MNRTIRALASVLLASVIAMGCGKQEEQDTAVLPPIRQGPGTSEIAAPPAELPELGQTLVMGLDLGGGAATARSYTIAEVDQDKLDEIGVPAYPGAMGLQPEDPTPEEAAAAQMVTLDHPDRVASYYEERLPEATDITRMMRAGSKLVAAAGSGMAGALEEHGAKAESVDTGMQAADDVMALSRSLISREMGCMIVTLPEPHSGLTIIAVAPAPDEQLAKMEETAKLMESAGATGGEDSEALSEALGKAFGEGMQGTFEGVDEALEAGATGAEEQMAGKTDASATEEPDEE